jgi:hypothetical protein
MERETPAIPLSTFFVITIVGQLVFTIPAIMIVLVFKLLQFDALLFIALPTIIIAIPVIAYFSWLLAKGSNWVNTKSAVIVSCIFPGRFFGVLVGGLLGYRLYGIVGGALLTILFFFGVNYVGRHLGELLVNKFIPE